MENLTTKAEKKAQVPPQPLLRVSFVPELYLHMARVTIWLVRVTQQYPHREES